MKILVLNLRKALEYADMGWVKPVYEEFQEAGELVSEGGIGTATSLEVAYYEVTSEGVKHLDKMNPWIRVLQ